MAPHDPSLDYKVACLEEANVQDVFKATNLPETKGDSCVLRHISTQDSEKVESRIKPRH